MCTGGRGGGEAPTVARVVTGLAWAVVAKRQGGKSANGGSGGCGGDDGGGDGKGEKTLSWY